MVAHPVEKCRRFLQHLHDEALASGSDNEVVNAASRLEKARDALNWWRKFQPGIPEPHSLTEHPVIQHQIAAARATRREALENTTQLQVEHGSAMLTLEEHMTLVQACNTSASVEGMLMRALINIGIATAQRPDDLARRKFCQLAVSTIPFQPDAATALIFSGQISKASEVKKKLSTCRCFVTRTHHCALLVALLSGLSIARISQCCHSHCLMTWKQGAHLSECTACSSRTSPTAQ